MFDWVDLLIVATATHALTGVLWFVAIWLYSRRRRHEFTVVLHLLEHNSDIDVYRVEHCANPREALVKAAAQKLGCSLSEAAKHIDRYPYYSFVFEGHQHPY